MLPSWHFIFGFLGQSKIHAERSLDNELNTPNTIITNATGTGSVCWKLRGEKLEQQQPPFHVPCLSRPLEKLAGRWTGHFPSKKAEISAHAPKPALGRLQHWIGFNWVGCFHSCDHAGGTGKPSEPTPTTQCPSAELQWSVRDPEHLQHERHSGNT